MSKNLHSIDESGFYSNFKNMVEQYHLSALDPGSLDSDGTKRYATDMKEKYIFLATQPQTFKENRIS